MQIIRRSNTRPFKRRGRFFLRLTFTAYKSCKQDCDDVKQVLYIHIRSIFARDLTNGYLHLKKFIYAGALNE